MKKIERFTWICLVVWLSFGIGGCNLNDSNTKPTTDPGNVTVKQPETPVVSPVDMVDVKVYFATHDATHVKAEIFSVKRDATLLRRTMELLAAGPRQAEHIAVIPPGTRVRAVTVRDRTAFVDFTGEMVKRGFGGSSMEMLTVGAIVNTLTEFPDIEKVQILVEGRKVSTLFGHMDVSEAMSRSPAIIKK